ncbi:hypothetical protein HMPREF1544_11533 [Mucor circinelloides 1006PhL]|uniref:Uncharacterized protein n=1 Tax=Mucor circinelloides f. circinelloides (strain 1006PhL) TaxID=1220926 RepID=S2J0V6_MUCC1|nr:hypothetical protein HMPREF1544_11533 [Mucor circinelloides 1006PhL]
MASLLYVKFTGIPPFRLQQPNISPPTDYNTRKFDVDAVVHGATGFTGEYLGQEVNSDICWASQCSWSIQKIKCIVDGYHTQAKKTKVMIVNSCGFDSVRSDLGVFILVYSGGIMRSLVLAFTDSSVTSQQRPDPYLLAALKRDPDFDNL